MFSHGLKSLGIGPDMHGHCALSGLRGLAVVEGRELSAMRNVARATLTTRWQRGHTGFMLLPLTPSRNESAALQWGHGPNDANAMIASLHERADARFADNAASGTGLDQAPTARTPYPRGGGVAP